MRTKTVNVMFGLFLAVVLALPGCGGGGSDSSSDVGANFKGNTTQALVTKDNAKALSVGVVESVQDSSLAGGLGKSVSETPGTYPQMLQIATIIENNVANVQIKTSVAKTVADIGHHTENGYSGSCSISGSPELNGDISGTITFNSYRQYSYSPMISGSADYRASVSITGEVKSLHVSLSSLHGENGSRSYTLNGIMNLKNNDSTVTLDLSVVMLDNTINKTYWMKDCTIVMTGNMNSVSGTYTMNLIGTYYDHDLGYVDISTVTPATVTSGSGIFTAGQFLITGRNSTQARLTCRSASPWYTVEFYENSTWVPVN